MITAPLNHLLVTIKQKYQDLTHGGIIIPTKFNPEKYVTVTATVHSVPRALQKRVDYDRHTLDGIMPGDTIIMRYAVIYAYLNQPEGEEAPIFKNLIWWKGQEYWMCDIQHVLAVVRDGEIRMRNGYVMCHMPFDTPPMIYIPNTIKTLQRCESAIIQHIGAPAPGYEPLTAEQGDVAHFKFGIAEAYAVGRMAFTVIKQKYIFGVSKQKELSDLVVSDLDSKPQLN